MYEYQKVFAMRVVESLLLNDGEEITALFSRQSGKSEAMAAVLSGVSVVLPVLGKEGVPECEPFKDGMMIGLFAPTHEQVNTTYSRALANLKSRQGQEILSDDEIDDALVGGRELRLRGGSFVKGMTGAKQAFIESKSFHFVIIEESQDMDSVKVRKSIHPMLAAYNGTIVKVGTANNKKSDFHSAILRNRANYAQSGNRNHFEFGYGEVIKWKKKQYKIDKNPFHLKYAKFIEKEKQRLGTDSEEFIMSYEVRFVLEKGMFITDTAFEDMLHTSMKTHNKEKKAHCVIGIDIGKSNAVTVATVMKVDLGNPDELGQCEKTLLDWYEIVGSYEEQFHQLGEVFGRYNVVRVVMDATGVGDAFTDRVKFAWGQDLFIEGFKFTTSSKSDLYKYLDEEIRANRVLVPASARTRKTMKFKRFRTQMLGLEKGWKGAFLSVHKPDEKWAYDDYADSLALAVWAGKDEVLAEIEHEEFSVKPKKLRPTAYW